MAIAIGKANIDGGGRKKSFKLKANEANEYRLLPPLGKLASVGQWDQGVAVHWGYSTSSDRMRPFQCVEQIQWVKGSKEKIVTQACPRCVKSAQVQALFDKKEQEFKNQGLSPDTIKAKLKPVSDYLQRFNRSFRFFANAMNAAQEIGRLDYSSRHRKLLVKEMKDLESKGVDATGVDSGVFFNFTYEGTEGHKVSVVTESKGDGSFTLKKLPLTQSIIDRLEAESHDLTDLFPVITLAQVQSLVDAEKSPELPALVDSIFGASQQASPNAPTTVDPDADDPELSAFSDAVPTGTPATTAPAQAAPAAAASTATAVKVPEAIGAISDGDFENLFKK